MPKIFLHIGANKTGTTALQLFFGLNADALRLRGILYPKMGRQEPGVGKMPHHNLATALGYGAGDSAFREDYTHRLKEKFLNEMATVNCDKVVISSEIFMLRRDASKVAEFFCDMDVSVVVYLRRHDSWFESLFAQAIKTVHRPAWGLSPDKFIAHQQKASGHFINYIELLRHWSDAFGRDRIIVRPYEEQQNRPGIVSDFLTTIGAGQDIHSLITEDARFNASLPAQALMLIDFLNRSVMPKPIRQLITARIITRFENTKSTSLFPPDLRQQLVAQYQNDYEWIAREYLGRTDGRLFFEGLCSNDEKFETLQHPDFFSAVMLTMKSITHLGRNKL